MLEYMINIQLHVPGIKLFQFCRSLDFQRFWVVVVGVSFQKVVDDMTVSSQECSTA